MTILEKARKCKMPNYLSTSCKKPNSPVRLSSIIKMEQILSIYEDSLSKDVYLGYNNNNTAVNNKEDTTMENNKYTDFIRMSREQLGGTARNVKYIKYAAMPTIS